MPNGGFAHRERVAQRNLRLHNRTGPAVNSLLLRSGRCDNKYRLEILAITKLKIFDWVFATQIKAVLWIKIVSREYVPHIVSNCRFGRSHFNDEGIGSPTVGVICVSNPHTSKVVNFHLVYGYSHPFNHAEFWSHLDQTIVISGMDSILNLIIRHAERHWTDLQSFGATGNRLKGYGHIGVRNTSICENANARFIRNIFTVGMKPYSIYRTGVWELQKQPAGHRFPRINRSGLQFPVKSCPSIINHHGVPCVWLSPIHMADFYREDQRFRNWHPPYA